MNYFDKKKEEVKEVVKEPIATIPAPEVKPQEKVEPQTFVIKTELDAYISERLQTQPKTLAEIAVRDVISPLDGTHALTLPKEIKKSLESRGFTAFWINKKKKAIDHALNDRGWTIYNRVYFPEIPKHNFTANGTVETGDCILGFMPAKNAERLRKIPGEVSSERMKNLPMDRYKESRADERIGYYKPAYTAEPEGQIMQKDGAGLFAQPDLQTQNQ